MAKVVKNKKRKLNIIKVIILAIVMSSIVAYAIWASITLIKNPTDTFMVEEGTLLLEESVDGYIIRDETIVQGENYGSRIVKIKDDGAKVSNGSAIFRYQNDKEDELNSKIEELDIKIEEALADEDGIYVKDIALLNSQIKAKLDEVYNLNDIQKINKIKNDINSYINKKAQIAGEKSPAGSYIKNLITERSEYERKLNSSSERVTATKSGVVSYGIDGYEAILSPSNLDAITKNILESIEIKTGRLIESSNKEAKIVNNFEAYVVAIMDSESAMSAEEGDKVVIQIGAQTEIKATIEKIKELDANERMIFFKIKNGIESTINYRKIHLDVRWWSSTGLKVPNSAIISENGFNYVIRNRAGYTDKIMIKIVKQNDSYSLIENYETSELKELGYSSTEIKYFKKIGMYDEIILKPEQNKKEN